MVNFGSTRKLRTRWLIAGTVGVPIAAMSVYLWLSRWPARVSSPNSDYVAFAICMFIGVLFLVCLPFRIWVRALIVAVYAPVACAILFFYSLLFVGLAFGDWL